MENESKNSEYLKSEAFLAVCEVWSFSAEYMKYTVLFHSATCSLLGKKSVLWHRALHIDPPVFSTGLSHC